MVTETVIADLDDWLNSEEPEAMPAPTICHDVPSIHPVECHVHSHTLRANLFAFQQCMDRYRDGVFELFAGCSESVSLDGIRLLDDDGDYIEEDLYIAVVVLDALIEEPLQVLDVVPLPAHDCNDFE